MGNWNEAVDLICPKCNAMNRPRATVIEVEKGEATCGVCSHHWRLQRREWLVPAMVATVALLLSGLGAM